MPSQTQVEANRRKARKCTGPTTAEGKARSSRNSFRHGLASAAALEDCDEQVAKLRDLLCGDDAGEDERQQAAIVAECQVFLARVRAARVITIERMRVRGVEYFMQGYITQRRTDTLMSLVESGFINSESGDLDRAVRKLQRLAAKVVRAESKHIKEQHRCRHSLGGSLTQDGVTTHRNGERVPLGDWESISLVLGELRALSRYEARALSRRRKAIERLTAIKHLAEVRATGGATRT